MSTFRRFILPSFVFILYPKCDIFITAEQVLFWELKPYIWRGNDGNMIGIIPDMFKNANTYCAQGNERRRLNFTVQFKGYEEFTKTLASNITYGDSILKNVSTSGKPFWMPFLIEKEKINQTALNRRNLGMLAISSATSMSVVVPRRRINLPVKLIRGIIACSSIVSIALMLSVFFGALIWILERNHGSAFNDCIFNGLWWSQVTMTTTGYGDFVPVTCLGKIAASTWMFCGVIVVAVTTATVSDSVNGISGLEIKERSVAVLKNSYEELIAYRDFNATIVPCNSYEDVFENVKNGKADAALFNTDVLAWNIEKLKDNLNRRNHLSVIQHIPVEFPIGFAGEIINKTSDFFNCIYKSYEKEVVIWPQ